MFVVVSVVPETVVFVRPGDPTARVLPSLSNETENPKNWVGLFVPSRTFASFQVKPVQS